MKEATGELNLTVIVVIIVAGLVAFFSIYVGPILIGGIKNTANCEDAICTKDGCDAAPEGVCNCVYWQLDPVTKRKTGETVQITCPDKG